MPDLSSDELLFEIETPLGFSVRVTRGYWQRIVSIKHPVMRGESASVRQTLETPNHVRQSQSDAAVHLFYRQKRSAGRASWRSNSTAAVS